MDLDLRALVGPDGRMLGQGLVAGRSLLTPVHVLDPELPATVASVDLHGCRHELTLHTRVATDVAADLSLLSGACERATGFELRIRRSPAIGTALEIFAVVVPASRRSTGRLVVVRTEVLAIVEVAEHRYRSAAGHPLIARHVMACCLAERLPPGWSGAAVFVRDTDELIGFVHGNAARNNGRAVCLIPSAASPVLARWHETSAEVHP